MACTGRWAWPLARNQCRVRVDNAAQNFATLRRIVMNLLRQDRTAKVGLKNRRLKVSASDNYLAQLPGWQASPGNLKIS